MKQRIIPKEIMEKARILTKRVRFLTGEEKELYMGGLVHAMLWAKSVEEERR